MAVVALANSVVLVGAYLAVAALVWAIADATMAQPRDIDGFDAVLTPAAPGASRTCRTSMSWASAMASASKAAGRGRAATYGWRGSGGAGALHASEPLDAILITGDMTDAGRSSEWAEFLDAVMRHPGLAGRMLMIPGNHDLNIVDRANPARLDLPMSPNKRLRNCGCWRRWPWSRASASASWIGAPPPRRDPGAGNGPPSRGDGRIRRRRQAAHVEGADGVVDRSVSDGAAADRTTVWESSCSTPTPIRTSLSPTHLGWSRRIRPAAWTSPARSIRRHAGSSRSIITSSSIRARPRRCPTRRDRLDQRQLVRPPAAAARRSGDPDARSPPRRLDRRMRRPCDPVRAVSGHGGDRRSAPASTFTPWRWGPTGVCGSAPATRHHSGHPGSAG